MARIRSVHPGLFTDEAFVSVSMPARVFLIGVWTESDDHGVFEWKPVSLKMRLFPADSIDALVMLDELAAADQVRKVECGGKQYGIVRNFCKWQHPKKPTYKHPLPPEWWEYVGFNSIASTTSTPPVPHQTTAAAPDRSQREREVKKGGGENGEEKNGGGVVERAKPARQPKELPNDVRLIAGNLLVQFKGAYRGTISKAAECKFLAMVTTGENADPIIAAARAANPDMPAEQWLAEEAWKQLPLNPSLPPKKPLISPEANDLSAELAKIAGQDPTFLEPGWCGAAYTCQTWLDQGWPRDLIVAGVRSMVAARHPEKISTFKYFDKGIARFIADHRRPVPKVIEHQQQTVEVTHAKTAHTDNPRSGLGAIGRVYQRLREAAVEGDHGGGGEMPNAPVRSLPA